LIVVTTIAFFVVEWLLLELARLPYRPPEDMSTLLGTEIRYVGYFILSLASAGVCLLGFWALRYRFTSRAYLAYAVLLCLLFGLFSAVMAYPLWPVSRQ
jgi:hypothetical protein